MKFFTRVISLSFFAVLFVGLHTPVLAAPAAAPDPFGLQATRNETQYKDAKQSLPELIGSVISVGLSLIGFVFLGLALYAGYKWMTAQGNEKDVTVARDTLINASVGIILIISAYALTNFIFTNVITPVTSGTTADAGTSGSDAAAPVAPEQQQQKQSVLTACCFDKNGDPLGVVIADTIDQSATECVSEYPASYAKSTMGTCKGTFNGKAYTDSGAYANP